MRVFSLVDPDNPMRAVDLFAEHVLDFEELWQRSEEIALRDTRVRVASIPDLIELKRRAGRDQEANRLEASLAATPAQRLEWLEEGIELGWETGALSLEGGPWERRFPERD